MKGRGESQLVGPPCISIILFAVEETAGSQITSFEISGDTVQRDSRHAAVFCLRFRAVNYKKCRPVRTIHRRSDYGKNKYRQEQFQQGKTAMSGIFSGKVQGLCSFLV